MDHLPWVLLGLRTAPKDDISSSVAEMVYGALLTVPGSLITPEHEPDPAHHLQRLRDIVGNLALAPDAWQGIRKALT